MRMERGDVECLQSLSYHYKVIEPKAHTRIASHLWQSVADIKILYGKNRGKIIALYRIHIPHTHLLLYFSKGLRRVESVYKALNSM